MPFVIILIEKLRVKIMKSHSYDGTIKKILSTAICLIGSAILILISVSFYKENTEKDTNLFPQAQNAIENSESSHKEIEINLSTLYSQNAILIDMSNGNIIAEKDSDSKIYPASLTKIMTAIVTLEQCDNIYGTVKIPRDIFDSLYSEDASMAGFLPEEQATYLDIVYGMLLPSGAECCLTAAEYITGDESSFVELMNQKASDLGMNDTHFENTTGLHSKNHYTTVKDIAKLTFFALKNENFRQAFTSQYYSIAPTDEHPDGFTFYSTLSMYIDNYATNNGSILGGKTGFTDEAGLCLASLANINGNEYLLVTAKADGNHSSQQYNITDAFYVYNQIGNKL